MDWLLKNKEESLLKANAIPFPNTKNENFRFTNINLDKYLQQNNVASTIERVEKDTSESALLEIKLEESYFSGTHENILKPLQKEFENGGELKKYIEHPFVDDKFAFLTASEWRYGAALHAPQDFKEEKPFRIHYTGTASREAVRNIICLEKNSSITLVQEYSGSDHDRLVLELTQIYLLENSELHLILIGQQGASTLAMVRQYIDLAKGAKCKITYIQKGAQKIQNRLLVNLKGEESYLNMSAAIHASGDQHFDIWNEVHHQANNCKAEMDYFFLAKDNSKSIFNGLIQVEKEKINCEAYQKTKSLLLSNKATVHSIPKLIIQTDDVKCAHGASISSVNPEQTHYLQSRGIAKQQAEQMIIEGFTEPVYRRISTDFLYEKAKGELRSLMQ